MSSDRSAMPVEPTTENTHARSTRSLPTLTAVLIALAIAIPAAVAVASPTPVVAASCGWSSVTRPPDSLRVLRVATGRIEVVGFRKYVLTVMGLEWPAYLPQAVVEAGAVATKQYAWYHAVYSRRSTNDGRCYNVKDSTSDQLYKPRWADVKPDHYRAVDATWGVTLRKYDRFFMTGYRRGEAVGCGRDATGWKLFAKSATRCAYRGYGWRLILDTYYSPALAFRSGDGEAGAPSSGSTTSVSSSLSLSAQPLGQPDASTTSQRITRSEPDTAVLGTDRVQAVTWRGSWRRTASYLGSAGSSATFRFVGSSLELLGTKGPDRGWLEIFVDGSLISTVDLSAPTEERRASIFSYRWSDATARTVLIKVVGTAERPRVELETILVGR